MCITLDVDVITADALSEFWFAGYLTIGEYDALTMALILAAAKPVHQLSQIEKLSYQIAQVF